VQTVDVLREAIIGLHSAALEDLDVAAEDARDRALPSRLLRLDAPPAFGAQAGDRAGRALLVVCAGEEGLQARQGERAEATPAGGLSIFSTAAPLSTGRGRPVDPRRNSHQVTEGRAQSSSIN